MVTEPLPASGDPVELARALVRIPSVNPDLEAGGAGEGEIARMCADLLRGWGFETEAPETAPGRSSVVARVGRGTPSLVLNGHLDTVGVDGMTEPPFSGALDGGRIRGRGAADMKGGVAAILWAARELTRRGGLHRGTLQVVLTADEEHASIGLRDLLDRGLAADAAVVCEPTSLAIMPANKGFVWIEATFRGRAAHGSRPDLGRDAIRAAGRTLAALDAWERQAAADSPHPLLGRGSIHAGTISGGSTPSVYPESCSLVLEARLLPGEDPDEAVARVRRIASAHPSPSDGVEVAIERGLYRPGAALPGDHALIAGLGASIEAEGLPVRVEGMTAWVEAAWFVDAGIPALCFGPGSIDDAHGSRESLAADEVRAAARVLERFAGDFLGIRDP